MIFLATEQQTSHVMFKFLSDQLSYLDSWANNADSDQEISDNCTEKKQSGDTLTKTHSCTLDDDALQVQHAAASDTAEKTGDFEIDQTRHGVLIAEKSHIELDHHPYKRPKTAGTNYREQFDRRCAARSWNSIGPMHLSQNACRQHHYAKLCNPSISPIKCERLDFRIEATIIHVSKSSQTLSANSN